MTPTQEGPYRLYAQATDQIGNAEGQQDWFSGAFYAIDPSHAPVVTLTSPASNITTPEAAVEVFGQVTSYVDSYGVTHRARSPGFEVDCPGVNCVVIPAAWENNMQPRTFRAMVLVPPGTHTVRAIALDRAGNVGGAAPCARSQQTAPATPPRLSRYVTIAMSRRGICT